MVESYIILSAGIVVVGITAYDFFYTTLSFNGAGFLNRTVIGVISSFFLVGTKYISNRRMLKFSGLSHVLISTGVWIGLLWTGLFLILSSSASVVHAISREPANLINIFYFSGYTLSTLGNGEFIPASRSWQLVVAVFSFSGFIFITTAMSYLLNLASAVLHKRSLALFISDLGETPEEIVANTYGEGSFSLLLERVSSLQEKVNRHGQNHYAYPISHYFYSTSRTESVAVNLASLSEALTIIQYYVEKDTSAVERDVRPLRNAVNRFLDTVQQSFITDLEEHEEILPNLEKMSGLGVPVVRHSNIQHTDAAVKNERLLYAGYLKSCGWSWKDVYHKG